MEPSEFLPRFANTFAASHVYSEPFQQGDTTIITAASVRGGGGIRQGTENGESGGGMGLSARPVGAYVLRGERVTWKPAFDLSRLAARGQIVLAVAALVLGGLALSRR